MRQFLRSLFLFLPCCLVGYVVLVCLWGSFAPDFFKKNLNYRRGSYGHLYSRLQEVRQVRNIDLLILGSSHAYRGFDTRIFQEAGFQAFNLGSSSQTPLQTRILLKRYLHTLNPQTVLYEVYPGSFSSDGVESSVDLIANDQNDLESLKMAVHINHIKTWNTLIYGFYRDIFYKNNSFSEAIVKESDRYISGGYVEKDLSYFKPQTPKIQHWELQEDQVQAFEEILDLLSARNIRVILVQAPMPASEYASYTNRAAVDSLLSSYGEYHNFNGMSGLNDSLHFYDADHLNQTGVAVFNRRLIAEVLKKNSFK